MSTLIVDDLITCISSFIKKNTSSRPSSWNSIHWYFSCFFTPTADMQQRLLNSFNQNLSLLMQSLNQEQPLIYNLQRMEEFLQVRYRGINSAENRFRNSIAQQYIVLNFFRGFSSDSITWCSKEDNGLLSGLKSILAHPKFCYHYRAKSLVEALNRTKIIAARDTSTDILEYLGQLEVVTKPSNPRAGSFDSYQFEDSNLEYAQGLLRNLAHSDMRHDNFDDANTILQSLLTIAIELPVNQHRTKLDISL